MNGSLRLVATKKQEIADLLAQSYDCISNDSAWKTTPKTLRNIPTSYLRHLDQHSRRPNDHMQKMMDWASWELARSALDESIKNSVGLLLYVDKVDRLNQDEVEQTIKSFNTKYVSNFAPGVLYFCHLHSVLAGLAFAGFVIRDARYMARVSQQYPRWRCINGSWVEDYKTDQRRQPQTQVFRQYDGIRNAQLNWLPERSDNLKKLKETREMMTYKMERMGGWQLDSPINQIKAIFPDHVNFQEHNLELVCDAVDGVRWDRTYNPCERTGPLRSRFADYKDLARLITGP